MARGGARAGAGRKPKAAADQAANAEQSPAIEAAAGPAPEGVKVHRPQPSERGRPSSYRPEFAKQAEKICQLGATDADLADFFEIDVRTIYRWLNAHEDFRHAVKSGKDHADERVERSLYQRAVGYQVEAVKIFMPKGAAEPVYAAYMENVQPDTTAAIFWLKNRRAEQWRDKREVHHSGGFERASELTDDQLADIAARSGEGASAEAPGARKASRVR